MSKETYYFSHDYNSRTDPKIKKLMAKHHWEGYGLFWALVEELYNNGNILPTDYESLAFDMRVDRQLLFSVINDFGLFVVQNGLFHSDSVKNRLSLREGRAQSARDSANARWEKERKKRENDANVSKNDANVKNLDAIALRTHSDRIANALPTYENLYVGNAIKESKVKESKKDINIPFVDFWNLYDKKNDRVKCEKAWENLTDETRVKVMEFLPKYKLKQPDAQYRKNPITFFNNKTWQDEEINKVEIKTNGQLQRRINDFI